jgi:hypothetical protein
MIKSFLMHLREEENVRSSNVYEGKDTMGEDKK